MLQYDEMSFDGNACHHVAAWQDWKRLQRAKQACRTAMGWR